MKSRFLVIGLVMIIVVGFSVNVAAFDFINFIKRMLGIQPKEVAVSPEDIVIEEIIENVSKPTIKPEKPEPKVEEVKIKEVKKASIIIIVNETDLVRLKPVAYDPDKDRLTYTYTSPFNEKGEWQTTYGDAGEYTITVTASDGELSTSRDVLVIVNRKEERPTIDFYLPEKDVIVIDENSTLEFSIKASDLNNDPLVYEWKLDGKPVSNTTSFTYKISFDDAGSHTVKVGISDGMFETTKIWAVTVRNVNRPPVLEKIPNIKVKETEKVVIKPKATDPDGDQISFSISEPVGDDGVWETTYEDAGTYEIKVIASDGMDNVTQIVKVVVENVNRPPVIEDIVLG